LVFISFMPRLSNRVIPGNYGTNRSTSAIPPRRRRRSSHAFASSTSHHDPSRPLFKNSPRNFCFPCACSTWFCADSIPLKMT
jgi:hypothetical protein